MYAVFPDEIKITMESGYLLSVEIVAHHHPGNCSLINIFSNAAVNVDNSSYDHDQRILESRSDLGIFKDPS